MELGSRASITSLPTKPRQICGGAHGGIQVRGLLKDPHMHLTCLEKFRWHYMCLSFFVRRFLVFRFEFSIYSPS